MKIYHTITIDLAREDKNPPIVLGVEGDSGTHYLAMRLLAEGESWDIPGGVGALVNFVRPDGTGGTYDSLPDGQPAWYVEKGVLYVALAPACFACPTAPGEMILLSVTLLQGDRQLTTRRIALAVQRHLAGYDEGGDNYVSFAALIRQYIGDTDKLNTENTATIVDAVNEALERCESSVVSVRNLRVSESHELLVTLTNGQVLNAGRVLVPGSIGGISTVCGIAPDNDGDVPLTAADVGAASAAWTQQHLVRENLLDNWYFKNVVNQRMADSYYQHGDAFDRWSISDEVTAAANHFGLDLYCQSPNTYMEQIVVDPRHLNGCVVTLSALLSENSGDFHLWLLKESGGALTPLCHGSTDDTGLLSICCTLEALGEGDRLVVRFGNGSGSSQNYKLDGVKLEQGIFSTLAWEENGSWRISCVPDYSQQLLRCQRFFQVFRTQSLRPAYAADFRPPLQAEPAMFTFTRGGVTYYAATAVL